MEFPSFNHHHNRYVPPPPPPDSFSDNHPNNFPHHHHFIPPVHLPPPPPLYPSLPMPPPPPLLPVPPPPPSYNPHQSHFTFLDAQNPSFPNHNRSSPPPPRFSNQFHQFDYRTDSRSDPHRIAPELPHRNPILPDNHNRRMHSPNPQSESYYNHNGSERVIPSSRFRDDTNSDAYASRDISNIVSQEKQGFRGSPNKDRNTDRYASGNSVTNMDKPTCSNSRKLGDYVENYEPHYKPTPENQRIWDHHGEEDPKWVMKGKKNGVSFVSDREQSRVREGGEEFKQVQKKSVLLRIGKPNNTNRNRNHDQHSSKTKLVESNNNKSKGKDKDRNRDHTGKDSSLHTDQKIEKDREHSPVDLDVSFISNTLVAKPVLTPSSPIGDTNNTKNPRNEKNKKSNKFGSPLSKFSDRLTSPEKVPKQQKDKKTVNDSVNGSSSCPGLENGVNNGGSGRLSFRLKKKRKLMNLDSVASNFQLAVKNNKSLKSEIVKSTPIVPISSDVSFPPLEESNSSKDGSKVKNTSLGDDSTENKNLTSQKVSINGLVIDLNQQPVENENESLLILENEISATDVNLSVDGTDSLGQGQIEIKKCQTESNSRFDSCSDEIIVENSNVDILDLTNVDNQTCFNNGSIKIHEDGPKESLNPVIIADDNATTHEGNSFNKDEVTDMVISVSPENREFIPSTDETYLVQNDDLPPFSTHADETCAVVTNPNDKSVESMPDIVTNIVSSQKISSKSADKTISDSSILKNNNNIYENSESKDAALLNRTGQLEVTKTVSNTKVQGLNLPIKKRDPVPTVPKVFANRSNPVFTISRINKPANNITKPRTWHRSTDNPVPQPPKKQIVTNQNSYIRTGNSLVRKLNPSGPIETRNSLAPVTKMSNTYSRTSAPVIVRPNTPPLSTNTKLPDYPSHTRSLPSSPLEHIPSSPVEEDLSVHKVSQDQNSENQKIHYVKRKSNQLVATSSSDQIHDLDKNQTSVSDGYYKRRKNQLIRSTVDDESANSDQHKASKINIKRQSGKGIYKKYKNLRFPSVWTLNSSESLGKSQKLSAPLFPWKRSRNWGNMMNSIPSNSSSSSISRKLLHSRNREMIYTRSKHGFSLKMSKLLSVGGSGLKWSKSIEKKSKRANEEATLAVAVAEKEKREQNGSAEIKRRERIYRIGLVRYKMDPSRRTLQRISGDEEPSTSVQPKEEIRKSYIPKRLKIGHEEYVRIGNGNQLVRNPKRRTRMFANEKVRWSLHTARSRLAKKKKYCQFFTRFGKCNKDDGKCPYIHDSSKIAVCTKFLNGLCSNPNCNLTHKVIPERMQDCSYFSQGMCSNENCPYRHVNVSSSASICEGFLKGYCADGNECRKKHTYACPIYEATGECPQGTKCKLHHPKNRKTGSKRKQQDKTQQTQKNSRGRYFGSFMGLETMLVSEKHHVRDDDDVDKDTLCEDGKFGEYISLDCGNEEVVSEQRRMLADESWGLDVTDLDELTKPIRIMNRIV